MTNQLIPRLHFKQFNNKWNKKKLNNLAQVNTGKSNYNKNILKNSLNKYLVLGSKGIISYSRTFDYKGNFILIARVGAHAGDIYTYDGKVKISDNTIYLKTNNIVFLSNLLNKINLRKLAFGSGQPLIKSTDIKKLKINVPTLSEQQQIGAFFAKLDHMIKLQTKRLSHLKKLKKGYLQKMFPQKGENIPRLRFNGFHNEWDKKKLGNIVKWQRGKDLLKTSLNIHQKGNPVVHYADLYKFNAIQNNVIHWSTKNEGVLIPDNALLFPMSDVTPNGLATTTHMINKNHNIKASGDTLISKINNKYNSSYISYFINAHPSKILRLVTGTSIKHINAKSLSIIELNIPSIQEQNKIGQFFKNLDHSITQQTNKLNQVKELKKAYLQKMFI